MMNEQLYNLVTNISYSLIFGGLIVVLFTIGSFNDNALIGSITGYSCACVSIILLAGLTYTSISTGIKTPHWGNILTVLTPFFILVAILCFSISILSIYFTQISEKKVTEYYTSFSYMYVLFILLQLGIFFNATKEKEFMENGYIKSVTLMKFFLLSIINIIILITLAITLKYFTTDG